MALLNLQIVDKGTKNQRYRVSLPKVLIESHKWQNCSFRLEVIDGKIVLTPVEKR